jgi:hypothetical protein
MRSLIFAGALVCFWVCRFITFPTLAATRYVDSSVSASGDGMSWETALKTIQEGIDAAAEADTVIVAEGTYIENIRFNGENITLTSTDPSHAATVAGTVIDGGLKGPVVTFSGTEGEICVLSGFTIQNGKAWWGGGISGYGNRARIEYNTIRCNSADYAGGMNWCGGTIWKNIVTQNSAGRDGGGLCNCHGAIEDNIISRNSAGRCGGGLAFCENAVTGNIIAENTASEGGGLYKCPGTIENNTVSGNSAEFGGGLCDCDGTIQSNIVTANASYGEYKYLGLGNSRNMGGGGLCDCDGIIEGNAVTQNRAVYGAGLSTCYGTIRSNQIHANQAEKNGGGLFLCSGTIQNNVVSQNSSDEGGGGLASCGGIIQNSTIVGNSAATGGGLYYCQGTILSCIIWANTGYPQVCESKAPSYCCIESWPYGGEGNIFLDPHFADAERGDFHLRTWSPCIDAGDPGSAFENEPEPNGGRVNMGAYGNTPEAASKSPDGDGDDLPDDWELHWFGRLEYDGLGDADGDCILNAMEYRYGWDPTVFAEATVHNSTKDLWFAAIQAAIFESRDGDEIVVHSGVYSENVNLAGKNVVLRSTNPTDEGVVSNTVIDGGDIAPVVTLLGTEDESCVLSGLTIRNGTGNHGGGVCGGNQEARARATIQYCVITSNAFYGVAWCDGLIQNNRIIENFGCGIIACDGCILNNLVSGNSGGWEGGGLAFCGGDIWNNVVSSNSSRYGGGLAECNGTVEGNEILDNQARGFWEGGLFFEGGLGGALYRCNGIIQNNLIVGNRADVYGGGISECGATVQNNVVSRNHAPNGGALDSCEGTVQNNTIVDNSADCGGGLWFCKGAIRNCIIWGNFATVSGSQLHDSATPVFSCIQDWSERGNGNISSDPLFLDAAGGDYHLRDDSPCLDAGLDYYWFAWPQRALDGKCRLAGKAVDMGCDERGASSDSDGDLLSDADEVPHGCDPDNADTDGDGLRDGLEILRGSDPLIHTAPRVVHVPSDMSPIQASVGLAVAGDEIIVAPGEYRENLQFCGAEVTLRSSDPRSQAVVARTILDGAGVGSVVSFVGTEGETCLVSGFTIVSGLGFCGGGICGGTWENKTRATIEANIITRNTAWRGGGLALCDGAIRNNIVSGNSAEYGGGISECCGIVQNNIVSLNSATVFGGGLCWCGGLIQNNIIVANSAETGGGAHGCGSIASDGTISISHFSNNTVYGNRAAKAGGGLSESSVTIRNSVVWGNGAPEGAQLHDSREMTYCCVLDLNLPGEGNIGVAPRFVNAEDGDFRLKPDSPCVDAGSNDRDLPETDIAGMHRIMYGGKSLTVDMGAYEYYINDLTPGSNPDETTFTWSSLADKTYSIFYTDDLFNWHTAIANFPSSGSQTTSWTDDGSLTGLPPLLAPKRFYRILENP